MIKQCTYITYIGSMYGVFPYIYHKQINHSCRYIYTIHGSYGYFPNISLFFSDILDEYPKVFCSVVSFYPSQQSWLNMIIPHLQATDLVMLRALVFFDISFDEFHFDTDTTSTKLLKNINMSYHVCVLPDRCWNQ